MGIVKTARQLITKAFQSTKLTSHDGEALYRLLGPDYQYGTKSRDFLEKAYGQNPYVFMVVDRIVQRLVQVDKLILDRSGKEVENPNPSFMELMARPNAKENGDAFIYRAASTYLVTGECFVIRHQAPGEDDYYFVPVNYNVTINEDTDGNVLGYHVITFGKTKPYLPNEVLHISKPDITLDTNHGFSTLRATRKVWESNNEVWASEATLHKNKGITGVLYSDGSRPMTPTEEEDLQNKYDTDYTGRNNFGKVKVSTAKLGYIPMGMNPNDLKSIETRLEHLRTICASYNVDSKLFGDPGAATYNNMAEAQRAFIMNAVLPLAEVILPAIAEFIAKSSFQFYSLAVDEDSILELQLTKDQKSARIGREVIQGILTQRQATAILYPELEVEREEEGPTTTEAKSEGDTLEDNPAAESANDQAQANLRGSVGGVQGILQIQASVIAGATPRDSAIAILIQIYGFDEGTANDILGND